MRPKQIFCWSISSKRSNILTLQVGWWYFASKWQDAHKFHFRSFQTASAFCLKICTATEIKKFPYLSVFIFLWFNEISWITVIFRNDFMPLNILEHTKKTWLKGKNLITWKFHCGNFPNNSKTLLHMCKWYLLINANLIDAKKCYQW